MKLHSNPVTQTIVPTFHQFASDFYQDSWKLHLWENKSSLYLMYFWYIPISQLRPYSVWFITVLATFCTEIVSYENKRCGCDNYIIISPNLTDLNVYYELKFLAMSPWFFWGK